MTDQAHTAIATVIAVATKAGANRQCLAAITSAAIRVAAYSSEGRPQHQAGEQVPTAKSPRTQRRKRSPPTENLAEWSQLDSDTKPPTGHIASRLSTLEQQVATLIGRVSKLEAHQLHTPFLASLSSKPLATEQASDGDGEAMDQGGEASALGQADIAGGWANLTDLAASK